VQPLISLDYEGFSLGFPDPPEKNALLVAYADDLKLTVLSVPTDALATDEPWELIELPDRTEFIVAVAEEFLQVIDDDIEDVITSPFMVGAILGHIVTMALNKIIRADEMKGE
jgi:hypothetical protein